MSRLIRNAKSASDWTSNELDAYRVIVEEQDPAVFFGAGELLEPNCPRDFLTCRVRSANTDEATDDLLWRMEEAMRGTDPGEGAVDEFASRLLSALGFTSRAVHSSIRRRAELQMGGEVKSAEADVCLIHDSAILLLVQEDKASGRPPRRAEGQLVAEAIAARQFNVAGGVVNGGSTMVVPAIVMEGTYPVFYKVPVSAELDVSVRSLSYPGETTHVARCSPRLPRPAFQYSEGMGPLDNRLVILGYYEAFRRYVFVPCSEETLGAPLDLPL
jgi:hypothetical protein